MSDPDADMVVWRAKVETRAAKLAAEGKIPAEVATLQTRRAKRQRGKRNEYPADAIKSAIDAGHGGRSMTHLIKYLVGRKLAPDGATMDAAGWQEAVKTQLQEGTLDTTESGAPMWIEVSK